MLRESRTSYKFWTFIRGKMHVSYYSALIRKNPQPSSTFKNPYINIIYRIIYIQGLNISNQTLWWATNLRKTKHHIWGYGDFLEF